MKPAILFVDDELNILLGLQRNLRNKRDEWDMAFLESGDSALEHMATHPSDVVVTDMRMPGMDGIQFLQEVMARSPDTVRIMLTGNTDQETAINAINNGNIFSFHNKPCSTEELSQAIEKAIRQHQLITAERTLLERTLAGSVKVLIDVLSILDPDAFSNRGVIQERAHSITEALGDSRSWELNIAVMLSTIGQIALPSEIVSKLQGGRELSDSEKDIVTRVPEVGRNLIANIPRLKKVSEIIYYQNKGFDGSGFPDDDVAGDAILQEARLLKILNDLTEAEAREGTIEAAFAVLETYSSLYDPEILAAARSALLLDEDGKSQEPIKQSIEVQTYLLREGDLLVSDIKTTEGTLLLAAGSELTQMDIERLYNKQEIVQTDPTVQVVRPEGPPGKLSLTRKTEADYVQVDHNEE